MFRKLGIPLLSIIGVIFAIFMVILGLRKPPIPEIENPPPLPPYAHYVTGAGIIEANLLNIQIGTAIDGLIEEVFVQPGQIVEKDTPLFRVDTRELIAQKQEAESSQKVALANLTKLRREPRPETVPPLEAQVKQAKMHLSDEFSQYSLFQNVSDKRAISFNEFSQRKFAAQVAKYEYEQAKANLDLLKAGAWIEDINIAIAQLEEASAHLLVLETNLQRATVLAPTQGQVLQVNIGVGDFVRGSNDAAVFRDPPIVFGKIDPLHVRIDIDEEDAWRIVPKAKAIAFVRGNRGINFPLEFVRVEPFIIPKRSLTGENVERVDTRVLQLIYRFSKNSLPIYVGQLLDVYMESKPSQGL